MTNLRSLIKNKALIFSFVFALLYTTITFAAPYAASDAMLNPTCAPGALDCYVTPTSIGGTVSSATAGSIFFAGTSGVLAQDNAALFYDDTNNRLGVGTATPSVELEVVGDIVSKGTKWTLQTNVPDINDGQWEAFSDITYGNGLFVAVVWAATGNRIVTSPDGVNWTARTSPGTSRWQAVTYGNGLFVAVAAWNGHDKVMTSPDGITWTLRNAPLANPWNGIAYGNGTFVATGNSGYVMSSTDGVNWTLTSSGIANNWYGITYGNGLFVTVGQTGTGNRVMTSPDGVTWTSRTSPADVSWHEVTYGNGLFVAVAYNGTTATSVMTSPDGVTWTLRTSVGDGWSGITYANGLFVVSAGGAATNDSKIMTSPNGINWTLRATPAGYHFEDVTYGNGMFVTTGHSISGTTDVMLTSGKMNELSFSANNTSVSDMAINGLTVGRGLASIATNTGLGYQVLNANTTGDQNVAIGYQSMLVSTTGAQNTTLGYSTLYSNTTGSNNVALGRAALYSNTTGSNNHAIGHVLGSNTTGSDNNAVGYVTLASNTTGGSNNAYGNYNMALNTTGTYNVAFGHGTMYNNSTGSYNSALGSDSLNSNTTGIQNTAVGYRALHGNTTGSYNIGIGLRAGENITTGTNNIVIGYDIDAPSATTNGQMSIGNLIFATGLGATGTTISTGNIGIGTASPIVKFTNSATNVADFAAVNVDDLGMVWRIASTGAKSVAGFENTTDSVGANGVTVRTRNTAAGTYVLQLVANGVETASFTGDGSAFKPGGGAFTATSDARAKKDITVLDLGLDAINALNPVTFKYNGLYPSAPDNGKTYVGLIAQDVVGTPFEQYLVTTDTATGLYRLDPSAIPFALIGAAKEIDAKVISIENLDTDGTFMGNLREWLASATNGITELFAGKVKTNELCVGEVCVTEQQFLQIVNNGGNGSTSGSGSTSTGGDSSSTSTSGGTGTESTGTTGGDDTTTGGTTDTGSDSGSDTTSSTTGGEGATDSGSSTGGEGESGTSGSDTGSTTGE